MRVQFNCPNCDLPLKALPVLSSGPLAPRSCPSCQKRYFGGGGAGALAWFFTGLLIAFALGPLTPLPTEFFALCVFAGLLFSVLHSLRSRVEPIEQRRHDLARSMLVTAGSTLLLVAVITLRSGVS